MLFSSIDDIEKRKKDLENFKKEASEKRKKLLEKINKYKKKDEEKKLPEPRKRDFILIAKPVKKRKRKRPDRSKSFVVINEKYNITSDDEYVLIDN